MSSKYEHVKKPSEFKNNTLREVINFGPPEASGYNVNVSYLAIFDVNSNYSTREEVDALKQECFDSNDFSHISLDEPPIKTFGFGNDDYHFTIEVWAFESGDCDEDGMKTVEVFHVILMDSGLRIVDFGTIGQMDGGDIIH